MISVAKWELPGLPGQGLGAPALRFTDSLSVLTHNFLNHLRPGHCLSWVPMNVFLSNNMQSHEATGMSLFPFTGALLRVKIKLARKR